MPYYRTTLVCTVNANDRADAVHLTELHADRLRSVSSVILGGTIDATVVDEVGLEIGHSSAVVTKGDQAHTVSINRLIKAIVQCVGPDAVYDALTGR